MVDDPLATMDMPSTWTYDSDKQYIEQTSNIQARRE